MDAARISSWIRRGGAVSRATSWAVLRRGGCALTNLVFPPVCSLCAAELEAADWDDLLLCDSCRGLFSEQPRQACWQCASPRPEHWPADQACPRCYDRQYWFQRAIALGEYRGGVRRAVVNMKRAEFEPLMRSLGLLLGRAIRCQLPRPQLVVPVPMHWWRRFRRGTNTACRLATCAGRSVGVPVVTRLLFSQRRTNKQGTLLPQERARNVRDAFGVSTGYDIKNSEILLVDDVMTTGATLSEAARVLRRAGARSVSVAVVARGIGRQ